MSNEIDSIVLDNKTLTNLKKSIREQKQKIFNIFNGLFENFSNNLQMLTLTLESLSVWAE